MKNLIFLLILFPLNSPAQSDSALLKEIEDFQKEENEFYLNADTSPLTKKERRAFEHHDFFEINLDYIVEARFEKIMTVDTVIMGTSAGTKKSYQPFAMIYFKIGEDDCELTVYQSLKLREKEEYKDYLFIPFKDVTSGKSSYGGGRYLDITIPTTKTIRLNFNLAYNPYCAYTNGYFCTIPPKNNTLKVAIEAGLKAPPKH